MSSASGDKKCAKHLLAKSSLSPAPVPALAKPQPEAALDAEIAIIWRGVKWRFHAVNPLVLDLQIHLTADAAAGAGGARAGVGLQSAHDCFSVDFSVNSL